MITASSSTEARHDGTWYCTDLLEIAAAARGLAHAAQQKGTNNHTTARVNRETVAGDAGGRPNYLMTVPAQPPMCERSRCYSYVR